MNKKQRNANNQRSDGRDSLSRFIYREPNLNALLTACPGTPGKPAAKGGILSMGFV